MAVPAKLPTIKSRNGRVSGALLTWKGWIERLSNVTGRWPVMVNQSATGPVISVDLRALGPRIMVVTTTLPAATGTTTLTIGTSGRARDAKFNPSTNALTADTTADIVEVKNFHNKTFVSGGFIKAERMANIGEGLWAFDLNDCAKYV